METAVASRTDSKLGNPPKTWRDQFPWLLVLRAFRVAIGIQLLIVAGLCAVFVSAGWSLSAKCFTTPTASDADPTNSVAATLAADHEFLSKWPSERSEPALPQVPLLRGSTTLSRVHASAPASPVFALPARMILPAARLFERELSIGQFFYYLTGGLWTLVVWSVGGTAIARMALVKIGREGRIDMTSALSFAQRKSLSVLGATLMPLFGVLLLAIPIAVLGIVMRVGFGAFVAGLLWPVVILVGAMMAMMLLGILFGWPLVNVALAAEGTDAFDSVSRAYAYSFQRPWRYLGYALAAAVAGMLGWLLVWGFSEAVIAMGYWSTTWGMGRENVNVLVTNRDGLTGLTWAGAKMIGFWTGLARTIASGYGYSYFWCGMSCVYLLLRNDVDSTEWDHVYDSDGQNGIVYGLPAATSPAANGNVPEKTAGSA